MKFKLPESYILILIIVIIASLASYIVQAGEYDRVYNSDLDIISVVDNSYHTVDPSPITLKSFLNSIPEGMMAASELIVFILIIGGSFNIILATGIMSSYINRLKGSYVGKEHIIIFKIMLAFAIGGTVFGMSEELLPFYPIFVLLAISMKFDKLTGMSIVFIGSTAGFASGVVNPFTTGVAQSIAGIPLFSGVGFRIISFIVFFLTAYLYIYRHAMSVRNKGIIDTYDFYMPESSEYENQKERDLLVLIVLVLSILGLTYGIYKHQYGMTEMATVFMLMGIISGVVGGLKSNRIVTEFTSGASNMVYSALIIGLARAVLFVLESGKILDTIIYGSSKLIASTGPLLSTIGMFFVQMILNLFISSGSGQAAVTMPIMTNIADLADISRQTAVLAFQFGDGLMNIITPTSGLLMASLVICDIDWKAWIKWIMPLLLLWIIEGCVILSLAHIFNYGPF